MNRRGFLGLVAGVAAASVTPFGASRVFKGSEFKGLAFHPKAFAWATETLRVGDTVTIALPQRFRHRHSETARTYTTVITADVTA